MKHDLSDAPPIDLTAEQVAVLYKNAPIGIIANVVNATILTALEWSVVSHRTLQLWLLLMYAVSGFRLWLLFGYRRQQPASWRSAEWYRWSIVGSTMAAFGWGNTVWFLHPPIPLPYELIIVFVLAGMTAGATSVLCIAIPAFSLYHLAVGVPIIAQFVVFGDAVHMGMAAMIGLFLIGTAHAAWNLNRAVLTSVSLRLHNERLIDSLTGRSHAVERLNEALRKAHVDLERRIAERTLDLQRANDDLRIEVTERQRAETALRESDARFRHLTDNLNQAVWFVQVKPYQILYLSTAFERIWGLSPEQCYKDPDAWKMQVHPDDKAMVNEALDAAIAGNTGREFELTYRIIRSDGQVRWISDRCVVHRNEDGGIDRLSGISEDITESRKLEDQLRQAQKMEAVGRLAGGVAHDFNNVMTVILGYSAVLLQEIEPNSTAHRYVQEIQQAGERCASLTGQLLAFSRKQLLHPISLDLHAVIRNLMAMLTSLIGEQISISLRLDPTPRWVKADPVQLDQVLLNLALNARDAMPLGGTLLIETDVAPPADVAAGDHAATDERPYVRLRVHDTGTGMDPDTKARIFDPFFTTKPQGRGTGLGLATVYGIVHQSGGYIKVDSVPERGTTMTIYLPEVAPVLSVPITSSPQPVSPRTGSDIVLLVEDEPSVRNLTQHILRMNGYRVIEVEDGLHAVDLVRRQQTHIDLLITDMVMPGISGKELALRLRALFKTLPVLYVSGYSDKLPLTGEEDDGRSVFLQKPFSPEELIRKVREILHVQDRH
jgi:PAS domain S-box-containing protein